MLRLDALIRGISLDVSPVSALSSGEEQQHHEALTRSHTESLWDPGILLCGPHCPAV